MRKWRVGTVSMGITLILLGIVLLSSSFTEGAVDTYVLAWWPVILIVLGIEIIVYLFMAKKEKPVVHYDFVSIIFIGLLGTAGIGLYTLTSVGLMEEVKASIHHEYVEKQLPKLEKEVPEDINRIVVQAEHQQVDVETNKTNRLYLFGSYLESSSQNKALDQDNIAQVTEAGDTLYIQMLQGRNGGETAMNRTLSLPSHVEVEIRDAPEHLALSINSLEADWSIDSTYDVQLRLAENIDAKVQAKSQNPEQKDIDKVYGEGSHTLEFHGIHEFSME